MALFKKKKNSVIEEYSETVIDDLEYNGVQGLFMRSCVLMGHLQMIQIRTA